MAADFPPNLAHREFRPPPEFYPSCRCYHRQPATPIFPSDDLIYIITQQLAALDVLESIPLHGEISLMHAAVEEGLRRLSSPPANEAFRYPSALPVRRLGTGTNPSGRPRVRPLGQWRPAADHLVKITVPEWQHPPLYLRRVKKECEGTGVFLPPLEFQLKKGSGRQRQPQSLNKEALVEPPTAELGLPSEWPY